MSSNRTYTSGRRKFSIYLCCRLCKSLISTISQKVICIILRGRLNITIHGLSLKYHRAIITIVFVQILRTNVLRKLGISRLERI